MAAPIDLRNDFDSVSLRRLAKRTRDATQSRRLLALAEVYDGGSRTDASRIGGVGLQIMSRLGAALQRPRTGRAGRLGSHRAHPRSSTPITAAHWRRLLRPARSRRSNGVVRWRRKDLARWLLETFAISLDETTVGRELKALGFAKISARPRHYAQNELAVEAFKKNFPAELAKIRARLPKGVEIELWWQDEARIGQKLSPWRTRPRAPDRQLCRRLPAKACRIQPRHRPHGGVVSAHIPARHGFARPVGTGDAENTVQLLYNAATLTPDLP